MSMSGWSAVVQNHPAFRARVADLAGVCVPAPAKSLYAVASDRIHWKEGRPDPAEATIPQTLSAEEKLEARVLFEFAGLKVKKNE